jgi:hypothetical protein
MVYPGGGSSIRFEKMREGIADFEKLRILKNKAAKSADPAVRNLMQQLQQHLQTFTSEKDFNEEKLKSDLQKGKEMIEELSEKLK